MSVQKNNRSIRVTEECRSLDPGTNVRNVILHTQDTERGR